MYAGETLWHPWWAARVRFMSLEMQPRFRAGRVGLAIEPAHLNGVVEGTLSILSWPQVAGIGVTQGCHSK